MPSGHRSCETWHTLGALNSVCGRQSWHILLADTMLLLGVREKVLYPGHGQKFVGFARLEGCLLLLKLIKVVDLLTLASDAFTRAASRSDYSASESSFSWREGAVRVRTILPARRGFLGQVLDLLVIY